MRCDQMMGLPLEAIAFIEEHAVSRVVCPCCNRPYPRMLEKIGEFVGMFEESYALLRHQLKDGKYADEFLQAAPWSSGPCHFIGLKVFNPAAGELDPVQVFEWLQSDIDKA